MYVRNTKTYQMVLGRRIKKTKQIAKIRADESVSKTGQQHGCKKVGGIKVHEAAGEASIALIR
jgi:hypothetical protein